MATLLKTIFACLSCSLTLSPSPKPLRLLPTFCSHETLPHSGSPIFLCFSHPLSAHISNPESQDLKDNTGKKKKILDLGEGKQLS